MRNSLHELGYLARLSLLVAALAYLVVGVAGPSLHSHSSAPVAAATSPAPERDGGIPFPDGERGCFVCQVLSASGLPAVAARLPELSVRLASNPAPLLQSLSHRDPAPSRARAPPATYSL